MAEAVASRVGGDGEHRGVLDSGAGDSGEFPVGSSVGGYPAAVAGAGPENGCKRRRVDSDSAQSWIAARLLPAQRRNQPTAEPDPAEGGAGSRAERLDPADAEMPGSDERAGAPCGLRYARSHRHADAASHRGRRAEPPQAGRVSRGDRKSTRLN